MPIEKPTLNQQGKTKTYEWVLEGYMPVEKEVYAPSLGSMAPSVIIAPVKFCMDGFCGDMSDWKSLGQWMYSLQEKKNTIPASFSDKLLEMTKEATTDKEKIEILYKYLQSTTRYVSIQLGVGGYQPMPADKVAKSGFGDCKALSNYMKAMLDVVGIPSVYVGISTNIKNIYTDFASLTQMNHAILMVPLPNDTIWLECTSPINPFNYAHSCIAGHHALLINENGGEICRVKPMPETADNQSSYYHITVKDNGNATAEIRNDYKLEAYEDMQFFVHSLSHEEQLNYLADENAFAKAKISNLQIHTNDNETPHMQLAYNMHIDKFANKSGTRLFVPYSPLKHKFRALKTGERKHDIIISAGSVRNDTLIIDIPENFIQESLPKSNTIHSQFGNYSIANTFENNQLQIVQQLFIKQGRYPAGDYEQFREFFKQIEKESNKRAVFKIKTN